MGRSGLHQGPGHHGRPPDSLYQLLGLVVDRPGLVEDFQERILASAAFSSVPSMAPSSRPRRATPPRRSAVPNSSAPAHRPGGTGRGSLRPSTSGRPNQAIRTSRGHTAPHRFLTPAAAIIPAATVGWPPAPPTRPLRWAHTAVWTGSEMIVSGWIWHGFVGRETPVRDTIPAADSWTPTNVPTAFSRSHRSVDRHRNDRRGGNGMVFVNPLAIYKLGTRALGRRPPRPTRRKFGHVSHRSLERAAK